MTSPARPHRNTRLGIILLICIAASAGLADPALARSFYFTAQTGYSVQSRPASFKEQWNNGFGGALGAIFDTGTGVGLVGRLEYDRFPMNPATAIDNFGAVQAVLVSLSTRYAFFEDDDAYRPYIIAGYGTADLSLTTDDANRALTEYDGSDLRAFFQIGGGVELNLQSVFKILVEARYVSIRARFGLEPTSFFPLTVGVRF